MVLQRLLSHFFLSCCRPEAPHRELISHFSTERAFPWPHAILHSVCVSSLIYFVFSLSPLRVSVMVFCVSHSSTLARLPGSRNCFEDFCDSWPPQGKHKAVFIWPSTSAIGNIFRCVWPQMTQTDCGWFILIWRCTKILLKKVAPRAGTDPSRHWVHPGRGAGPLHAWDKNYKLKFCNRRIRVNLTTHHTKKSRESHKERAVGWRQRAPLLPMIHFHNKCARW